MSAEQQRILGVTINWLLKVAFTLMCVMGTIIFNDMHTDLKKLADDVSNIKERISKIEGSLGR